MLARFVPWKERDVEFAVEAPRAGEPLGRWALAWRTCLGGVAAGGVALGGLALAGGLQAVRGGRGFDVAPTLLALAKPGSVGEWTTSLGVLILALLGALATAATLVARRGVAPRA
jgi:hypothetical protein